jgi:HEAT repeat protein
MVKRSKRKLAVVTILAAFVIVTASIAWYLGYNHKIDRLEVDLGSAGYATRERAEDALGKVTSPLGIRRLIWHLGDKDAQSKGSEFALVLGMIGEPAINPLISMAESNATRPSYAALLPDFARAQLDEYIEASNTRRRNFANAVRQAFQYLGKPAVARLSGLLASPDFRVRSFAINTLVNVSDADVMSPLIRGLCDADINVRHEAWLALSRMSQGAIRGPITGLASAEIDLLANGLTDKDKNTRRAASAILGESDSSAAAEKLAALLVSPDADTRILGAVGLSIRSDKRALPILLEAVKERDKEHRGFSIGILGRYDDPEAVSLLVTAFNGPDDSTRFSAAWGLAQIIGRKGADQAARESAEKAIREALASDSDVKRKAALNALVSIKDGRAVEPLKQELRDSDLNKRVSALFGLGKYDTVDAGAAIINALHDKEARVRSTAAFALGRSRDPRAQEALISALKDSDAAVRDQAARSLHLRKSLDVARKNGARIADE